MAQQLKIIGVSGSLRQQSFNTRLLKEALCDLVSHDIETDLIDLSAAPLPFYNADDEASSGMPNEVRIAREKVIAADCLYIATPEYNGASPGVLKNFLDWMSRKETVDDVPLKAFSHKTAVMMSATVGASGGVRAMTGLNTQLAYLGVMVIPKRFSLINAGSCFTDSDGLAKEHIDRLKDFNRSVVAQIKRNND
ncbi:MAG: NAD(P)H-dependent oxidoreductase [Betaproteobacteria bacterium]